MTRRKSLANPSCDYFENSFFRFKARNPSLASLSSGQAADSQPVRSLQSSYFQFHVRDINTNQEILAQLRSSSSSNTMLIKTTVGRGGGVQSTSKSRVSTPSFFFFFFLSTNVPIWTNGST